MARASEPTTVADLRAASRAVAALLASEVERLRSRGVPVGEDDLRGLYVSDKEADRILMHAGVAGEGGPGAESAGPLLSALGERMTRLTETLRLSPREAATVALCLVTENDPELERLVSYVQDDVAKKRPRVELALRLFWDDPVAGQDAFDAQAPLRRHRLIALHDDAGQPATPLLARSLTLDARAARYLLGGDELDEALEHAVSTVEAADGRNPTGFESALDPRQLSPPVLALYGTDIARARRIALSFARACGLDGLLDLSLSQLREGLAVEGFERASREAALTRRALLIRGVEAIDERSRGEIVSALSTPIPALTLALWEGEPSWHGPAIPVGRLDFESRLTEWREALAAFSCAPSVEDDLPALAGKFQLDSGAIEAAAKTALGLATARDTGAPVIQREDLYSAARARSAPILSALAHKVEEHKDWADIILEPDPLAQLGELCGMVEHRHRVYDTWGFQKKLSSGKGVVSLFAGQSGTGKTMAAGVIARELGLDLYKIDLSGVVSKYIGETEKNLGAIFREASLSNAILFFDEADALFGKRSEVRDAHDRYANIETAYLLQQIEEYEGPVILSTNLKMNLDEAFLRRMHFVIDFPMPEEPYRLRIWQGTVPPEMPLAGDVDFGFLARQFRISGGNIRNIVLAAAFLAASDGDEVSMRHFIRGTRREFQKLGRMVTEADFGEHIVYLE